MKNILILTGAGISADSGVSTFRAEDGLWCQHRVEDVATPEGFAKNPALVHDFYNQRRGQLGGVEPNAAHKALARLEKEWAYGEVLLVTQNVDNLHERAGSHHLIHMHGELMKVRCIYTGHVYDWKGDTSTETFCDCCQMAGALRPHIVWFGEMPFQMDDIYNALARCDLFLSIGTSGNVYPAAGFVMEAKRAGAHTVELNLEPSQQKTLFDEKIYGRAKDTVPEFVEQLLRNSF